MLYQFVLFDHNPLLGAQLIDILVVIRLIGGFAFLHCYLIVLVHHHNYDRSPVKKGGSQLALIESKLAEILQTLDYWTRN